MSRTTLSAAMLNSKVPYKAHTETSRGDTMNWPTLSAAISRRNTIFITGGSIAGVCFLVGPTPAAAAAAAGLSPKEAKDTLFAARDSLKQLLDNWEKATIDCTSASVDNTLLATENKEKLLEKAKTSALFDKESAVMSCKSSSTKVRAFISKLKNLDKVFAAARNILNDDVDLDQWFAFIDKYNESMATANGVSYTSSFDLSSLNGKKTGTADSQDESKLSGSSDNLDSAKSALFTAQDSLAELCYMITASE